MFHLCIWNTKQFFKALDGAAIRFLITQNALENEEDMGLEPERSLKLFLINYVNLKQISLILFLCSLWCSFTSDSQENL
jgi:hypothetical protein